MAFNSLRFYFVFPVVFLVYWLLPARYNVSRKAWLELVSYLLYMNWRPAFAIVLLGVTLITFWGGYLLDAQEDKKRSKLIIWLYALLGLLPLLVFKYYTFINDNLTTGLTSIGLKFAMPGLN